MRENNYFFNNKKKETGKNGKIIIIGKKIIVFKEEFKFNGSFIYTRVVVHCFLFIAEAGGA